MTTIKINHSVTATPDFSGWHFYVEEGRLFDQLDYAEAYDLNHHDLEPQSVKAAQDAAGRLYPGEWLEITHEDIESDDVKNDYPNLTQELINAIAVVMDDEIREELHSEMAPCHPGEFLTAYLERDPSLSEVLHQYNTGETA